MRSFLSSIRHIAVLCLLLASVPAAAQSPQAEVRTLLQNRDAEIKRLLGTSDAQVTGERREQLRTMINGIIDFRAMSRGALGAHWDGLSDAQRTDFTSVFSGIIRGQSLRNLKPYRAAVAIESVDVSGTEARAVTTSTVDDVAMTVSYDLSHATGEWRIVDVIVDDVSTVEGYARSFQSVVRKRGFDSLMGSLRKKLAEVEAES